ncbi:MAG: galactokinase family protein, partial [Planctomycetota bacterium]
MLPSFIDQSVTTANESFKKRFDHSAKETAVAPGRVNLIGEHIDYNDGIVLPFAIDRYTAISGSKNDKSCIRLWSEKLDESAEVAIASGDVLQPRGDWTDYVIGVVGELQKQGIWVGGFDAAISSNVPLGAGLSSSASLEVATATVLEALFGFELGKKRKALLCQASEHNYAGVPCGIMDQFCVVYGAEDKLVKID